jgi:hypothetical protein
MKSILPGSPRFPVCSPAPRGGAATRLPLRLRAIAGSDYGAQLVLGQAPQSRAQRLFIGTDAALTAHRAPVRVHHDRHAVARTRGLSHIALVRRYGAEEAYSPVALGDRMTTGMARSVPAW